MNGHGREPPDKNKSDDIMPENESIMVCGSKIKEETIIKQEPELEYGIVTVSMSTNAATGATPDNSIRDTAINHTNNSNDFGDSTVAKVEMVKKEANENACESSHKKETPQNNAKKNFSKGKSQKSSGSNGVAKKKATHSQKKPKPKGNGNRKKTFTKNVNRKQHKCLLCDYVTNQKGHLKTHILKHTGEKPHPCTICSKRFKRKENLQYHMKIHVDEFLFSCSICLKGFDRNEEKVKHESCCTIRRYECHLCKEFSTMMKTNLEHHLRVHTGDKPFQCGHCSMKFIRAGHLKRHRKTHINPRPLKFKCSVCFKNFTQQTQKENHEVNCKQRGYKCDVCKSYITNDKSNLVKHIRIHTGEMPFRCEICSKCFSQIGHLNRHKKIHK